MHFPVTRPQLNSQSQNMLTPGKILRTYREKNSLLPQDIADATKIPIEQVYNIENDEFGTKEAQVFMRGFIKNYSDYLGLDTERVLAIYRRTFAAKLDQKNHSDGKSNGLFSSKQKDNTENNTHHQDRKNNSKFSKFSIVWTPRTIALAVGSLMILFLLIYLITQFYRFQQPPTITLTAPENNITVESDMIEIKGNTEPTAVVKINNENIPTSPTGDFSSNVKLTEGINTIVIKSYKNNNEEKSSVVTRNITYTKPVATTTDGTINETNETDPSLIHKVKITANTETIWITLNADGKQLYGGYVNKSKSIEYEFSNSLSIVNGKPNSSTILIDGNVVKMKAGTMKLNCTVGTSVSCK